MKRPCGGLSRCAFLANSRFTIAVAATRVAAAAKAVIAGYRLKATRQSDRNEGERVCGKAMCKYLVICTMPQANERCCSKPRTGEPSVRSNRNLRRLRGSHAFAI